MEDLGILVILDVLHFCDCWICICYMYHTSGEYFLQYQYNPQFTLSKNEFRKKLTEITQEITLKKHSWFVNFPENKNCSRGAFYFQRRVFFDSKMICRGRV